MDAKAISRLLLKLWTASLILLHSSAVIAKAPQPLHAMKNIFDVTADMVAANPARSTVRAFDISPDGSLLVILCADRNTSGGTELQGVLFSIAKRKVVQRTSLGGDYPQISGYLPHILFSYDQKYVVVQTTRTLQVLSAESLALIRVISVPDGPFKVPLDIHLSAAKDAVAITYGTGQPYTYSVEKAEVYTEFVRLSSERAVNGWQSDDKPQALSPDGSFAVLSDWNTPNSSGVLKLKIANAQTGAFARTVDTGYAFGSPPSGYPGRSVGNFMTDHELIVSPDNTRDTRGDEMNGKLKIVNWQSGAVEHEITAKGLSPTGELALAQNGKSFVVVSWFLDAYVAHHDVALPPRSSPAVFIFNDQGQVVAIGEHLDAKGLSVNGAVDVLRPRLSAEGSRLAIAQDGGIRVFDIQ
jgi:hypothetical protein